MVEPNRSLNTVGRLTASSPDSPKCRVILRQGPPGKEGFRVTGMFVCTFARGFLGIVCHTSVSRPSADKMNCFRLARFVAPDACSFSANSQLATGVISSALRRSPSAPQAQRFRAGFHRWRPFVGLLSQFFQSVA